MAKRWRVLASGLLFLFLVAGCYLASGQHVETEPLEEDRPGIHTVRFVSADGQTCQEIPAGLSNAPLIVVMSAEVEQGQLVLELLDSSGDPVVTATARLGPSEVVSGTVRTDGQGRFTLRVRATEAHRGSYTLRYRLAATPTPTPTSPPTPTP